MTNPMGQTSVPAAWYPDPADSRQLRYWDGMGWTGQLAPNPHIAAEPALPSRSAARRQHAFGQQPFGQFDSRDEPLHVSEPITGSIQFIPAPSTMVDPDYSYVPMTRGTGATATTRFTPAYGPTSTVVIWFYVLTPLLAVPFLLVGPGFDSGDPWSVARAALLGVMIVALAVFAGFDRVELQRREIPNAPSSLVGVIPVIFVIDRTARVGRSGAMVLLCSLLVQAGVGALIFWRLFPQFF